MTAEAVSTRGGWWCASCDPISSHPLRARTAFFSDKLIFFWFFSQFPPFPPPHSQRGRREPQTHKKYWLCSLPGECEALPLPVTISDTDTGVVKGGKKKKTRTHVSVGDNSHVYTLDNKTHFHLCSHRPKHTFFPHTYTHIMVRLHIGRNTKINFQSSHTHTHTGWVHGV